jgi:hypothetical protein
MMPFRKISNSVDLNGLRKECHEILSSRDSLQVGLQSDKHNGSWKDAIGKGTYMKETVFIYPVFAYPLINHYIKKYNMHRTRIFVSNPKTCLSWHQDRLPRIHIPIQTDPGCIMIVENEAMHLEAGSVYRVDTRKHHSAMNGSKLNRIHIVGCVSD